MIVYIPCYFNSSPLRKENFYKNITQYLSLGYKIVICWMNEEDFLIVHENVEVIKHSLVNISISRNVLLKHFYNSEGDYAIFSDDDTFLKTPKTTDLDCISFTNDYCKNLNETEWISPEFLIMCNFKKKYNIEPMFDEALKSNEDLDFGMQLNRLGIKTYRQSTDDVVLYKGKSSMFKNKMNMIHRKQISLKYIKNKYD